MFKFYFCRVHAQGAAPSTNKIAHSVSTTPRTTSANNRNALDNSNVNLNDNIVNSNGNYNYNVNSPSIASQAIQNSQGAGSIAGDQNDFEIDEKISDNKLRAALLKELATLVPGSVVFENKGRERSLTKVDDTPKVNVKPNWNGTWYDTPAPEGTDSIEYWPPSTKFPTKAANKVPEKSKHKIPIKFAYKAENKDLEHFLDNTISVSQNTVWLDSSAFESPSYKFPSTHLGTAFDQMIKEELSDNLVTDEFIDINEKLITSSLDLIQTNNENLSDADMIKRLEAKLITIQKTNTLSGASNLRGRHSILATYTFNKMSCREEVLADHNGLEYTKELLRGSSLFHSDLFGRLPESFQDRIIKNRSSYILRKKGTNPSSSAKTVSAAPVNSLKRSFINQGGNNSKSQNVGNLGFRTTPMSNTSQNYQKVQAPRASRPRGRGIGKKQ